jgi:hypothetical protein
MNFLRLGNIADDLPDHSADIRLIQFGEVVDGEFQGIAYHRARIAATESLKAIVPLWALERMEQTVMTINREVPPHVDNAISCVINVYLETSNCLTQFYHPSFNASSFRIENQTNGCIYDRRDLAPMDSFVAERGDVYLLDVSKPHAVWAQGDGEIKRTALCYQIRGLAFGDAARAIGAA